MSFSVIHPAFACRCYGQVNRLAILHCQRSINRRDCVVLFQRPFSKLIMRDFVCYRALARIGDASRYFHIHKALAFHHSVYGKLSIALRFSRVRELLASCRDRGRSRRDRQRSCFHRDRILAGHVRFSVHDPVAFIYGIVVFRIVRYVCHASAGCRFQNISLQQFSARDLHSRIAVGRSVIYPAFILRFDRDGYLLTILHLQRSIHIRYCVVPGISCREFMAYHLIRHASRIGDASFHFRCQLIFSHQIVDFIVIIAVGLSVIREGFARRRDRYRSRRDCQLAILGNFQFYFYARIIIFNSKHICS